jgi:UDP-glucose 4-epimerase
VKHTSADTSRAREKLGYAPRVTLEEGLARELAWLSSAAYLRAT